MQEIYYKEKKKARSKEEYILNFFGSASNKRYFSQTYYKDTDFIQCREKSGRSFQELFWLFKSRFKTATKGELARILLNRNNSFIGIYYCDDINKMVISKRHPHINVTGFINEDESPGFRGMYMDEELVEEGPNFDKLLKYALRSNRFSLDDINLNPI